MYSPYVVLILTLLCMPSVVLVKAALFILEPSQGSTCQGGQACTVRWVDDGQQPLLSAIGVCTVGLYTAKQQLVQNIAPVDVANTDSISFTPLPGAGPDSSDYYIFFASTQFFVNGSTPYTAFSPFFSLTGMSGSFNSPLPAAISSIPIPESLTNSSTSSGTRTITVGTLATSLSLSSPLLASATAATPSTLTSISRLSTSTIPASTSTPILTSTTSSLAPTSSASGASGSPSHRPVPLFVLFLAISSSAIFS